MVWAKGTGFDTWLERPPAPAVTEPSLRPIRLGVIGTGLGASLHFAALARLPQFDLVALCSRRHERAVAAAIDHNVPHQTTDYRELVRDPAVEAVVVAAPPHLHHPMAIAALEAGKHVLCEKPMARNLAEARDMVRIADRAGVVAMVNHQLRFLPVRARIKELIDEGYLGEPHAASVVVHRSSLNDPYGRPFGWLMEQEKAGGMLGAVGSHHVDALRWWFGDVKAVAGATSTMIKRRRLPDSSATAKVDADDNFAILLRFAGGALGTVHVTATAAYEGDEEITLSGSGGTLRVRDGLLLGAQTGDERLTELPIPARLTDDGTEPEPDAPGLRRPPPEPDADHYLTLPTRLLLRTFAAAVRDHEPAIPSFNDGVKVQEILDAVARSGHQGRWIDTSGARWPTA